MYQWHNNIPVVNDFDPARVCSMLLPIGVTPPGAMTPDMLATMDGYNVMIGAFPDQPTRYRILPEGYEPCFVCDEMGYYADGCTCGECGGRGYNRAPYAED